MEPTLPLFDEEPARPLADRLRPTRLDEVVGQDHLLAPDAPLGRMVAQQRLSSAILWGPPGVGKTTIARLLAHAGNLAFEPVPATFSGVADLRKVFATAQRRRGATRRPTVQPARSPTTLAGRAGPAGVRRRSPTAPLAAPPSSLSFRHHHSPRHTAYGTITSSHRQRASHCPAAAGSP
ncbi:AAA family ATPase [Streptomyces sp. 5-6(2022)]|uniref:AAA family ATPase n=1 Tax=Streptomyces sp. 5-6(2022) TaxID=2936510 RepID=UPI0023B8D969|nr:AAA family ATPase [Streptomyces sp. 5-6(2022)]